MKQDQLLPEHNTLDTLTTAIHETNGYFLNNMLRQVNTALTLRN